MKTRLYIFSVVFLVSLIFPSFASADVVVNLQAQISALLVQVQSLQEQLAQQTSQSVAEKWCHTFNTNLKYRSSGKDVIALQTALDKEGFSVSAKEGDFGEYTSSAVTGFQQKYKSEILTPWGLSYGTGFVGKTTRDKLNQLYRCGVVPTPTPTNQNLIITDVSGPTNLDANQTEGCPLGVIIEDNTEQNIPGIGDILSVQLINLGEDVLAKINVRGPYTYIDKQFMFLVFDTDRNPDTGQRWGDIGGEIKISWNLSGTVANIDKFNSSGERIDHGEIPLIFNDNNFYIYLPSEFVPEDFDFYFETSGDQGWSDMGHTNQIKLSKTNYEFSGDKNFLELPPQSKKINLFGNDYYSLPIDFNINLNPGAFISIPASYSDISDSVLKFKSDYSKYRGEIFQFAKLDQCEIPIISENKYYIPGDAFIGDYVNFIVPGNFIPASANSSESDYNDTLKTLIGSTNTIKIHDKGYEVQRELTNVDLDGVLIMFDYDIGGGAYVIDYIIKNGPFAFEDNRVPEFGGNFHEIGHFYTLSNNYFTNTYPDALYSEGFANILSHYTKQKLVDNYAFYGLSKQDKQLLLDDRSHWIKNFNCLEDLKSRKNFGEYFANGNGCIVQEATINLANKYGSLKFIENLMEIYNPLKENELLSIKHNTKEENTLFVASLSAAYGTDLRDYFEELSWPVDNGYFEKVYPILSSRIKVDQSQFISQSVPTIMISGRTYPVSVTIKNIGTTNWAETEKYSLGYQNLQDNLIWGLGRVNLNNNETIASGQSKIFTFNITAPATPGTYNFQWRMFQKEKEWFGDTSQNVAVKVSKLCTDSDSGKDYYVKGYGYDNIKYFSVNPFYDECHPTQSSILREVICREDDYVDNLEYICPNGCKDGACIKTSCTDSDGGKDYYTKGIVNAKDAKSVGDSCRHIFKNSGGSIQSDPVGACDGSECYIQELFCLSSGNLGYEEIPCPGGCSEGSCVRTTSQNIQTNQIANVLEGARVILDQMKNYLKSL